MGDISNIEDLDLEKHLQQRDIVINQNDAGGHLIILPRNGFTGMSRVDIYCNFVNSLRVGSVIIPYKEQIEQFFNYTNADYNNGLNENDKIVGFSGVGYNLIYPTNENTRLIDMADPESDDKVIKYLVLEMTNENKQNKCIGFHDNIYIPLNTEYSAKRTFMSEAARIAANTMGSLFDIGVGLAVWYVTGNPYAGATVASILLNGGSVTRYVGATPINGGKTINGNVSNRSIKLFKNNEVPVVDKKRGEIDFVSDMYDDPNVPGSTNIHEDNEEPIWHGESSCYIDLLDELEYTMTTNDDTFVFDIDQYNSDPVVASAPYESPRPIGIKKVIIHTDIPSTIPVMDSENPVNIQTNGTYGIQYDNSSNELSIVPANNNRSVSNVGTFDVSVPSTNITQISNYPITQNGTQTVPIPTGYDAVDSISLDVSIPNKIYITSIKYENQIHSLSSFSIRGSETSVSVNSTKMLVIISVFNTYVYVKCFCNGSTGAISMSFIQNSQGPTYYIMTSNPDITAYTTAVSFLDSNNNVIFDLYDNYVKDSMGVEGHFNRSLFEFVFN